MWQALIAPKPVWYWLVTAMAALATLGIYLVNDHERKGVRWSITEAGRGDFAEPELWFPPWYDGARLESFKARAGAAPLRSHTLGRAGRMSALERYVRPILLYNDVVYALALASLAALINLGLAGIWPRLAPLALVCSLSAVAYAAFDYLEDRRLAGLLSQTAPITDAQARTSSLLSAFKVASCFGSVSGGALHLAFGPIGAIVNGPGPK